MCEMNIDAGSVDERHVAVASVDGQTQNVRRVVMVTGSSLCHLPLHGEVGHIPGVR